MSIASGPSAGDLRESSLDMALTLGLGASWSACARVPGGAVQSRRRPCLAGALMKEGTPKRLTRCSRLLPNISRCWRDDHDTRAIVPHALGERCLELFVPAQVIQVAFARRHKSRVEVLGV